MMRRRPPKLYLAQGADGFVLRDVQGPIIEANYGLAVARALRVLPKGAFNIFTYKRLG